jgi:Fe-S-cluster-containing hydrogenase component 2
VEFKKKVVDAIRTVPSPENPFELCVVEFDKCIGCGLCAGVCPWDAIIMYNHDEALKVASTLTMAGHEPAPEEGSATEPTAAES